MNKQASYLHKEEWLKMRNLNIVADLRQVNILMIKLWKSIHKYNSRTQSAVLISKLLHQNEI